MNSMHNFIKIITVILVLSFIVIGCDKDCPDNKNPRCENYDPCSVYVPASSDFDAMIIPLQQPDCQRNGVLMNYEHVEDTIFARSDVYFRAKDSLGTFTWKIGTDPKIFTGREVKLFFPAHIIGNVQVTLYSEKQGPSQCSDNNYTRDTLTKSIHFLPDSYRAQDTKWSNLHGEWKGVNSDAPKDTFTIDIPHITNDLINDYLNNLPVGCQNEFLDIYLERKFIIIRAVGKISCKNPCGLGYVLDEDPNTIVIDYWLDGQTFPERIQKKFIGKRVN